MNFESWLQAGMVLQTKAGFILGEGDVSQKAMACEGFYKNDFFLKQKSYWYKPKNICKLSSKEFFQKLQAFDYKKTPQLKLVKQISFVDFQNLFFQAQNKIKQKVFKKVVPRFFEHLQGRIQVLNLLQNLFSNRHVSSQGYLYGCWQPQGGFLGFSPEILFSFDKTNKLQVEALAGTTQKDASSLFQNPKEVEEHNIVIASIKDALKELSWDSYSTKEICFGALKHLHTPMQARLGSLNFEDLVHRLHPTGALGGYPKKQAWDWLQKQNKHEQARFFGSPFGMFNGRNQGFCVVAIRGLAWSDKEVFLGAGFGLTKDSKLQKEWQELLLKTQQIKKMFHLKVS